MANNFFKNIDLKLVVLVALLGVVFIPTSWANTSRRSERSYIKGGVIVARDTTQQSVVADSLALDSLVVDSLVMDSLVMARIKAADSVRMSEERPPIPEEWMSDGQRDEREMRGGGGQDRAPMGASGATNVEGERAPFFSDSMSLSRVCWTATALPGFGQIYNKQYWKLPILYSTVAAGATLFAYETKKYKPLKAEYDELSIGLWRTDEMNELQANVIRSNTRRQLYLGMMAASYIYFIGDAAVNYTSNETSNIKRATTLATIFPGAGQIYNKQYWKVPFVVGGFASMIYVVDWNNRGYQRFKKAYTLIVDYENNPDKYPDGSPDEFSGRYSADYMESLRDSYRRNRDLSIILTVALYVFQIIDAHVDAHFQDFDISDDLSMSLEPSVGYSYSPSTGGDMATYGFNFALKF